MVKKKSLSVSPLGATIILVLLSIIVGAFAISIGESFIEENAEFTRSGAEEVRAGCSAVSLEVTKVSGITVACIKKNKNIVDISLDNGPDIDLSDLHIKLLGSQSVKNFQTSLKEPLKKADGIRLILPYDGIGEVQQVKITPKVIVSNFLVFCKDKALILDNLQYC